MADNAAGGYWINACLIEDGDIGVSQLVRCVVTFVAGDVIVVGCTVYVPGGSTVCQQVYPFGIKYVACLALVDIG